MKCKIILAVVTAVIIGIIGVLMHNPPSLIDVVTGATPKSRSKSAPAASESYVLAVNTNAVDADSIRGAISGKTSGRRITITLFIVDDSNTEQKAKQISENLRKSGFNVKIRTYNETMLFSRAVSGKYELLMYPSGLAAPEIPGAELVKISGEVGS